MRSSVDGVRVVGVVPRLRARVVLISITHATIHTEGSPVSEYNPFQEIERAIGQMSEQFGMGLGEIPMDVVDEGETFRVHVDLPGVDPSEVEVSLHEGHRLTVDVDQEAYVETSDGRYVRRERHRDAASRTISLPAPVDEDSASATYDDGVLTVTLDKRTTDDEGTDIPVN